MRKHLKILSLLLLFTTSLGAIEDKSKDPYSHPGIVAFRDGQWLGSDHLLNLSDHVNVLVELSAPDEVEIPVTAVALTQSIDEIFQKGGITPDAEVKPGKPDLPLFHVLAMIYPIRDGFAFSITASLFEDVKLARINLDENVTMQAITWDRQSINIASTDKFKEELISSVNEMANTFVERYKFFEMLKNQK